MENLKLIENDLVPVYTTDTGEKVVYGTELHESLQVRSNYREWIKRRFAECDAVENEDYTSVEISTLAGGTPKKQHIIKLDTAKEMAMLERNERGKQVRRYFIRIEKKYKEKEMNLSQLSPELQMFGALFQALANQEIAQKEQEERMNRLDSRLDSIRDVISLSSSDWRKDSGKLITKIALRRGGYEYIRNVRDESYRMLELRMGVSLGTRLTNKKKNMAFNGVPKSKIDQVNQLDVISDDRKLVEGYVAIIKEMAIKYGVGAA